MATEKKETKVKKETTGKQTVTASAPKAKNTKLNDIGLDVSQPPTEGCSDDKCPYHGGLKVRGRIFEGTAKSTKMQNSVVVEWDYVAPVRKYQRFMRRKSRVVAHRPPCITVHANDNVRIAECRPLSKTKGFVILETLKKAGKAN